VTCEVRSNSSTTYVGALWTPVSTVGAVSTVSTISSAGLPYATEARLDVRVVRVERSSELDEMRRGVHEDDAAIVGDDDLATVVGEQVTRDLTVEREITISEHRRAGYTGSAVDR
jgi:hypothetical protein